MLCSARGAQVDCACVVRDVTGWCVAGWCVVRQLLIGLDERLGNRLLQGAVAVIPTTVKTAQKEVCAVFTVPAITSMAACKSLFPCVVCYSPAVMCTVEWCGTMFVTVGGGALEVVAI